MNNLIGLCVNDCDDVLLVAHGDGLTVGAPAEVDVLALGLHCVCALSSWGGGTGVGTSNSKELAGDTFKTSTQPKFSLAPPTSDVPDLDCLVSRGRHQLVGVGGAPTDLVHTV